MARPIPMMTVATGMGPLPELVEAQAGTNALERVFRRSDLPLELVSHRQQRIPLAAMVRLFEEATRETGDDMFGIRVGSDMEPGVFGLWMNYSLAAPTLRQAIDRLIWSIPLHQSGPSVQLDEQDGGATWTYRVPQFVGIDGLPHLYHALPVMLSVAKFYLGAEWTPEWIGIRGCDGSAQRAASRFLGIPCRSVGHGVSVPIPLEALDRAVPKRPADLLTRADVLAEIQQRSESPVRAVEACIALDLLDGSSKVDGVARRLGYSVRSLQRHLSQEGTDYSELLDRVRRRKALELMSRPSVQVTDVAFTLGYSDPANFTRAFRRWTGLPPSEFLVSGD